MPLLNSTQEALLKEARETLKKIEGMGKIVLKGGSKLDVDVSGSLSEIMRCVKIIKTGDIVNVIQNAGKFAEINHRHIISEIIDLEEKLDNLQPLIPPGNEYQYFRGDKTMQVLDTLAVVENNNLYFTAERARAAIVGGASTVVAANLTASRALISNDLGKIAVSDVTGTELNNLTGSTGNIQGQISNKQDHHTYLDAISGLPADDGKFLVFNGTTVVSRFIQSSDLPAAALTDVYVANSEAEQLALPATVGDYCFRTDIQAQYILKALPASSLSNWQQFYSTAGVVTVDGRPGPTVVLSDLYAPISHTHNYEPAFSKNTAFNKNFGTTAGAVAQGNHTHNYEPYLGVPDPAVTGYLLSSTPTGVRSWVAPYAHPSQAAINLTLTGAKVLSALSVNGLGHVITASTRTLTLADLGFTGALNANYYVHPTGDGYLHVPATGTINSGKFLKAGATAGSLSWAAITASDLPAHTLTSHSDWSTWFNQQLRSTDAPSFTGLSVTTNSGSSPFYVTRTGNAAESLKFYLDDSTAHIYRKNDEATGAIRLTIENTDTETGGGANANIAYWEVFSDGSNANFRLNRGGNSYTYYHTGNLLFGITDGTMCEGDDPRLSDARTPLSHTHNELRGQNYISGGVELPNYFRGGQLRYQMLKGGGSNGGGPLSYWYDCLWISSYSSSDVKRSNMLIMNKGGDPFIGFRQQDYDAAVWGTLYTLYGTHNLSISGTVNYIPKYTSTSGFGNSRIVHDSTSTTFSVPTTGLYFPYEEVLKINRDDGALRILGGVDTNSAMLYLSGEKNQGTAALTSSKSSDGSCTSIVAGSAIEFNTWSSSILSNRLSVIGYAGLSTLATDAELRLLAGNGVSVNSNMTLMSGNIFDIYGVLSLREKFVASPLIYTSAPPAELPNNHPMIVINYMINVNHTISKAGAFDGQVLLILRAVGLGPTYDLRVEDAVVGPHKMAIFAYSATAGKWISHI